jgi:hypothetical protein
VFKRGEAPLGKSPPLLEKERGLKGVRSVSKPTYGDDKGFSV